MKKDRLKCFKTSTHLLFSPTLAPALTRSIYEKENFKKSKRTRGNGVHDYHESRWYSLHRCDEKFWRFNRDKIEAIKRENYKIYQDLMQILSHILAITLIVMVSFLSIQIINESSCIDEKSYQTYFKIHQGLNSTNKSLNKSISCEHQGLFQRRVRISQENAAYKIDYRNSNFRYDFKQKLVPPKKITKNKGQ